jgi:energy-coupling factor transporter transmembrane protein EcfT
MRLRLHPATRIVVWLGLVFCAQTLIGLALASLSIVLILMLWLGGFTRFLELLRRSRLLLASLALIYGWATPGAEMAPALGPFSPSIEGLASGALQAWRLVLLLAALAVLFEALSPKELLSALYFIMRSLRVSGLDPERASVRVWLTLRYAQQAARSSQRFFARNPSLTLSPSEDLVMVPYPPLTRCDALVLLASAIVFSLCFVW